MTTNRLPDDVRTSIKEEAAAQVRSLAVMLILLLWRACVACVLWNWFAAPLGIKAISFTSALGLICLVEVMVPRFTAEVGGKALTYGFCVPLLGLLIGAAAKAAL